MCRPLARALAARESRRFGRGAFCSHRLPSFSTPKVVCGRKSLLKQLGIEVSFFFYEANRKASGSPGSAQARGVLPRGNAFFRFLFQ